MLGPTHLAIEIAHHDHEERIAHATRIRALKADRTGVDGAVNHESHRLTTVRRLAAAGLAGVVLSAALALGGGAMVAAAPNHATGGGHALIR